MQYKSVSYLSVRSKDILSIYGIWIYIYIYSKFNQYLNMPQKYVTYLSAIFKDILSICDIWIYIYIYSKFKWRVVWCVVNFGSDLPYQGESIDNININITVILYWNSFELNESIHVDVEGVPQISKYVKRIPICIIGQGSRLECCRFLLLEDIMWIVSSNESQPLSTT